MGEKFKVWEVRSLDYVRPDVGRTMFSVRTFWEKKPSFGGSKFVLFEVRYFWVRSTTSLESTNEKYIYFTCKQITERLIIYEIIIIGF